MTLKTNRTRTRVQEKETNLNQLTEPRPSHRIQTTCSEWLSTVKASKC